MKKNRFFFLIFDRAGFILNDFCSCLLFCYWLTQGDGFRSSDESGLPDLSITVFLPFIV
jgi:hypothetical protein